MDIKIQGMDKLIAKLDNMCSLETITTAVQNACDIVEAAAKDKAPKDSGELRRSITNRIETDNGKIIGTVFTPLEYAPYVEYGTGLFAEGGNGRQDVPWSYKDDEGNWHSTRGMKPKPFMRPALKENRKRIKEIIKGALTND